MSSIMTITYEDIKSIPTGYILWYFDNARITNAWSKNNKKKKKSGGSGN